MTTAEGSGVVIDGQLTPSAESTQQEIRNGEYTTVRQYYPQARFYRNGDARVPVDVEDEDDSMGNLKMRKTTAKIWKRFSGKTVFG